MCSESRSMFDSLVMLMVLDYYDIANRRSDAA